MRYEVLLTEDAERDLEELHDYVFEHDAPGKADALLQRIARVIEGLATLPERGSYPKELLALGIREYRQAFFKPYRVIYRIVGAQVFVLLVADGRRHMQTLLARRLLGV
jgi:toxin ParE1/3/4